MAVKYWHRTGYTGGTDGTLDNIDGALLEDGDIAYVVTSAAFTVHRLNASSGAAESSPEIIAPDSNAGNKRWELVQSFASRTMATISKTIGATGDYATHALAMADVPDLLAHNVTHTIQTGTTLTESLNIKNKNGGGTLGAYILQAAKYYPTTGTLPVADSATGTTLVDADLATAALGDDYFNGCWIFIVDGTGTDNGYVPITDYTDATGTVTVASWPGTQPDATSRYIIVGALIDGASHSSIIMTVTSNYIPVYLYGIGFSNGDHHAISISNCSQTRIYSCGVYNADYAAISAEGCSIVYVYRSGIVLCNTDNSASYSGIYLDACQKALIAYTGLSDNCRYGVRVSGGSYAIMATCCGDANGTYGTYAQDGGVANCTGTECSGSSGDHSNGVGDGSLAY